MIHKMVELITSQGLHQTHCEKVCLRFCFTIYTSASFEMCVKICIKKPSQLHSFLKMHTGLSLGLSHPDFSPGEHCYTSVT